MVLPKLLNSGYATSFSPRRTRPISSVPPPGSSRRTFFRVSFSTGWPGTPLNSLPTILMFLADTFWISTSLMVPAAPLACCPSRNVFQARPQADADRHCHAIHRHVADRHPAQGGAVDFVEGDARRVGIADLDVGHGDVFEAAKRFRAQLARIGVRRQLAVAGDDIAARFGAGGLDHQRVVAAVDVTNTMFASRTTSVTARGLRTTVLNPASSWAWVSRPSP
jgi:hypothetical protein